MTEPPSLDQSRHKSDPEPGALLHWAMCLHCLTQDPFRDLMTAEAATKLPPQPTYTTSSVSREHWSILLYEERKQKKNKPDNLLCLLKTQNCFPCFVFCSFSSIIFFLHFLSVKRAESLFWEIYFSNIKGICTHYTNSLTATVFKVIFAKYSHTFIFIGSNYTSCLICARARGIKVSFYHSCPPCFHYLKRGCVHTSTKPCNFFCPL